MVPLLVVWIQAAAYTLTALDSEAPTSHRSLMTTAKRNVLLLAACQAIFITGSSLVVSVSALVGLDLAPDPRLATLPAGLLFLAAMTTTMPASLLMQQIGRQRGFVIGVSVGGLGAALSSVAILAGSFPLFCLGSALLGVLAGIAQYYRFAAADAVDTAHRPRAISLVLAGGLLAAFLGPNLAAYSRDAVDGGQFVGSFAAFAALQIVALALLFFLDLPLPSIEEQAGGGRPLGRLIRQPRYIVAVAAGVVAYATMSLLMTATPLAMAERGFSFGATASVIQWHLVGMFAPAFVSGRLVERYGTARIMILGAVSLVASVLASLAGATLWHFWIGLAALGVGWNFLFVAASSLLTQTYAPAEKAKAQGFNDLLVFGTVTCTATLAGTLHDTFGWRAMNYGALPAIGTLVCLVLWLAGRAAAAETTPVAPSG